MRNLESQMEIAVLWVQGIYELLGYRNKGSRSQVFLA
jgi:hypothetical protein